MSLLGLRRTGSGPLLVWLHGFTQTKDSGHLLRSILAGTFNIVTIDLPGHGENASIGASLEATADLLADALPDEPFILGGYSLGGRVALHFALRHASRVQQLVLLSTTQGIADEGERRQRRQRDDELARHIELVGTEAFLDEWLAQPMFASLPNDTTERLARSREASGLANSLRNSGTGTQSWLHDQLSFLQVPTLVIAGARDEKFVHEATLLHDVIQGSRLAIIEGAGHAAHLERPDEVAAQMVGAT
ncbi:MAG: alpha/beta fold hydrolase [Acidimicrobiales bacterium]